ncbi:hypothetical protein SDC9_196225 [bioreactor metagenome]|uniref:Uncharacterized protein n=1 Tax=bioreactor metagenome TaxID=1076179 RepID=A0A645IBG5_9ZZZZ
MTKYSTASMATGSSRLENILPAVASGAPPAVSRDRFGTKDIRGAPPN